MTLRLCCMTALLVVTSLFARSATTVWEHRGFTVEVELGSAEKLDAMKGAWEQQIDIVCAVGLDERVVEFFRAVPQRLVGAGKAPRGSPGLYRPKEGFVRLTSKIASTKGRPVLLHELLHAFHHKQLPDGNANRAIAALFASATKDGRFDRRAHMMQNGGEFFACAATTYLYGVTAQEPFDRERLKQQQPELFSYLVSLFGPSAGAFEGSLTSGPAHKDGVANGAEN